MSDETRASNGRRLASALVKLTISVGLLALLFSRVDTSQLWTRARHASLPWLLTALAVYALVLLASTWRWHLLLVAQEVDIARRKLLGSFLVATFFNNFLPSNIGGDFIRIRDTAPAARSKTLATTVVLIDRGLGLMGLVFIAALGASMAVGLHGQNVIPFWPAWLWTGFIVSAAVAIPVVLSPSHFSKLLQPLTWLHPEWVGRRLETVVRTLHKFRDRPSSIIGCFGGAVMVQALFVLVYVAVVHALDIPIAPWDLAFIVPLSLIVQMLPVSVNGFGVREVTFSFYFARLGLPIESAVLLSLFTAVLIMVCSLSGAAVYVTRDR